MQTSVYRFVQESLNNAARHARGGHVIVLVEPSSAGWLACAVTDGGPSRPRPRVPAGVGHGLQGMRERAELFGGRFWAGTTADGGWQVRADLPVSDTAGRAVHA